MCFPAVDQANLMQNPSNKSWFICVCVCGGATFESLGCGPLVFESSLQRW